MSTAKLQHIERALSVGAQINPGINDRGLHTGSRAKIQDGGKGRLARFDLDRLVENFFQRLQIDKIGTVKFKLRQWRQLCQSPLFQPRVVRSVEVIDADHRVTGIEQHSSDFRANKPGGPGNEITVRHE